ncbi:hypothetical protein SEPCBS119000_002331 [Sporothrix epigloea]|uniref:F-box domain-containing protein n=1 Tax=Sporothrix epigloea TaxID=1892477 RepID=A0ABP0DFM2_9PEZI
MSTMTASWVPGYHSAAEYHFCKEQAEAIARTVAYRHRDFERAVIWFSAGTHIDVRLSVATPFQSRADSGLGSLHKLPLELLYDVLFRLDMQSLFKFRQSSLRLRELITSLHEYQAVTTHGLNLVCALLRTRLADSVSLLDCYKALCTQTCELCGKFAGFISLLAWKRCCFRCLRMAPELQVQSLAATQKQFQLTKAEMGQLKTFKTLPGIYSMRERTRRLRITVVCVHQAVPVVREDALAQWQPVALPPLNILNFMGAVALPHHNAGSGKTEHGLSCAGCRLAFERRIIGYRGEQWFLEALDRLYSQAEFLEHFRWCEQAQRLWISSAEGTAQPSELPVIARLGGGHNMRE